MNRIDQKFEDLRKKNQKALITFITAGDPDYETTGALVLEMEKAGADIIELGIPFSDPIAEGPVIQSASQRALSGGATLTGIFDLVRHLRKQTEIPLLMMMYLNSIFRFGKERFFTLCEECGIDGVIVPDMPFEEHGEIDGTAEAHGIHSISLVAPTSGNRIEKIAKSGKGFLSCVSSTGVTGVRSGFETDFDTFFGQIRQYASVPTAVGFGISTPEQVKSMKQYCDGVIVGSAIVRMIAEHKEDAIIPVSEFVRSLKAAL